jgi:hypothetical protein
MVYCELINKLLFILQVRVSSEIVLFRNLFFFWVIIIIIIVIIIIVWMLAIVILFRFWISFDDFGAGFLLLILLKIFNRMDACCCLQRHFRYNRWPTYFLLFFFDLCGRRKHRLEPSNLVWYHNTTQAYSTTSYDILGMISFRKLLTVGFFVIVFLKMREARLPRNQNQKMPQNCGRTVN